MPTDAENATGRVSSARARSSALRPACGGLLLGIAAPHARETSLTLLARAHPSRSLAPLPSSPLCAALFSGPYGDDTDASRSTTSHLACGLLLPRVAYGLGWDTDPHRPLTTTRTGKRSRERDANTETRCRVRVDVDGDGAPTAGDGAVDEKVAGLERQMETSPSTSAVLKLEPDSEKRVCGVGDQERRRRCAHHFMYPRDGMAISMRTRAAHVHVRVGVDGEHEAQPTLALTLPDPPSLARPLSLASPSPPPAVGAPSVPASLGTAAPPTYPSLAMIRDDAAFTSLKARTDISPCDNVDTTPLPVSPPSVPHSGQPPRRPFVL
ncbi:hypothetical protein B0H13DRAFT_2381588 [Mycena leptocephala]|nr:hypothetical protein B0H13DRAFT_2381588 [Mycena leptocephala]